MAVSNMNLIRALVWQLRETQALGSGGPFNNQTGTNLLSRYFLTYINLNVQYVKNPSRRLSYSGGL